MGVKAMLASIWLRPRGPQQQRLRNVITALAKQHGTASFQPHLTVCSARDWDAAASAAAADYIRRSAILPLTVRKSGVSYSTTTPFQAIVIEVENNAELRSFREALRRIVGAGDPAPPHISLLYTIDGRGEQPEWWSSEARLCGIAQECAAQIEAPEFVLGDPVVVAPDGDWRNIKSWRVISSLQERGTRE
jgi:2'-5' RNA ligase